MTTPATDPLVTMLERRRACPEGVDLARNFDTLESLWEGLTDPDWMLWGLEAFGYAGDRKLRVFAASCAMRAQRRWSDPAALRAVELATTFATGAATLDELRAGQAAARKAAATIVDRSDFSEAMAAAASACISALRERPYDAARSTAAESARAVAWDPDADEGATEEIAWQVSELRRIVAADIPGLIAEIRKAERRTLNIL